jgi:phosphonate ABC transporter permease subunit PhnE
MDRRPSELAEKNRKKRRRRALVLGGLIGFLLYGIAVQKTDVDLAEIQSPQRRESLVRIMRALAHPNLVTYDSEEVTISADVLVPCPDGAEVPPVDTSQEAYLIVTPSCAAPGETVTVEGHGFEPNFDGSVEFRPDSEFSVTRRIGSFSSDDDGNFTTTATIPDRESENYQQVEATTGVKVGSWLHRVVVWTDANNNGVRDEQQMGAGGKLTLEVPAVADIPGAGLALVINDEVVQTITTEGDFTATGGPAAGLAMNAGIIGQSDIVIDSVSPEGAVEISAPAGTDLSPAEILVYSPSTGDRVAIQAITDTFALSPRISQNATDTLDKIIETVFMAFLATTIGTLIALPLSFMAARNLMRDIRTTVTNLALNLLAIPVGGFVGLWVSRWARGLAGLIGSDWLNLLVVIVLPIALVATLRAVLSEEDTEAPTSRERAVQMAITIAAGFVVAIWTYVTGTLLQHVGRAIQPNLGIFGFIGNFIAIVGEVGRLLLPVIAIVGTVGLMMNFGSKIGFALNDRLSETAIRSINLPLAAAAGATIAVMIGAIVDWFYEFESLWPTLWAPLIVGALIGVYLAARRRRSEGVSVGMIVYYMARTLFNTLRSIEPLVMVIVFVVWVGFGPFAGSLALSLHTAAALAKLYSEQVESIATGPIEAVRATGATRMQTIIYGVVPQIVPPYLSFTMYRWDINVRMSTIIGFAGGGGIGFLLQQNINLLQYRDAAAQMLAIAIVVATMDWISARLRERLV